MRTIRLPYGKETVEISLPARNLLGVLEGNFTEENIDYNSQLEEINRALINPIASPRLSELVSPGQKTVIMVSDITRPSPTALLLVPLVEELRSAGIRDEDIKIIFGLGIHRAHTREEQKSLIGEDLFNRIQAVDSCTEEYINIGHTSRGTPVNMCRSVVDAQVRICTGNIEYHYFAGYSGGAKALFPGAANYETIKGNHSLQLHEKAVTGILEGNPVREDMDEIGKLLPITFILNVVLNEKKQVLKAFAGDYLQAHREGCRFVDKVYGVKIPELADIVLVSAGGFPKDLNLYQSQKAFDNAAHAVKPGGIIILVARAQEGYGEKTFLEWIEAASTPDDLIARLKKEFVLGGHKAAAIARVLKKARGIMVSDMEQRLVEKVFFTCIKDAQEALDFALREKGKEAKVLVIPQGGAVLPRL